MYYNGYLFDFDGTLVNSMPTFAAVTRQILDEFHVSYGPDIVRIVTPLGYAGTAQYFHDLGLPLSADEIEALMKRYMSEHYLNTILAKDHVLEALQPLKARGARLPVLTASPHVLLDPCLKRNGLYELFDRVWSCDDLNTSKGDPDIYRRAADQMGLAIDEVLFLDDNLGATSTAASAGMPVCGVYDDTSAEYEDQIRAVSRHYIHSFSALPELQRTVS